MNGGKGNSTHERGLKVLTVLLAVFLVTECVAGIYLFRAFQNMGTDTPAASDSVATGLSAKKTGLSFATPQDAVQQIETVLGSDILERDGLRLKFSADEGALVITLESKELNDVKAAADRAQSEDERKVYMDTWTTTANSICADAQQQYKEAFGFKDDVIVRVDVAETIETEATENAVESGSDGAQN